MTKNKKESKTKKLECIPKETGEEEIIDELHPSEYFEETDE